MAGSTFLVLTNKLLRRLNEVELTSANFASAKNTQATAKDCIIAAIAEINSSEYQWPWNVQTGQATVKPGASQTVLFGTLDLTQVGQAENTPVTADCVPNWDSFKIGGTIEPNLLGGNPWLVERGEVSETTLKYISQEEWFKYHREIDARNRTLGQGVPRFVFPYTQGGFGVSPVPDDEYAIEYEMYITPAELSLYDDTAFSPIVWDYVVINMALKHYYMYKDNVEAAGYWINESNKTFSKMVNSNVNRSDSVWSNMVNFGGQKWSIDYTKV